MQKFAICCSKYPDVGLPVLDVVTKYRIPELTAVPRARQTLLTALKKVGKVASLGDVLGLVHTSTVCTCTL